MCFHSIDPDVGTGIDSHLHKLYRFSPQAIKLNERLHKYSDARGMLSKLKHESIDKVRT